MKQGFRTAGFLWALVGLALSTWAIWGLAVQPHIKSTVISWLIALAYGFLSFGGGWLTACGRTLGRYFLAASSAIALAYALVYFLFGGLADAFAYLPGIMALLALSAYTLFFFPKLGAHAT